MSGTRAKLIALLADQLKLLFLHPGGRGWRTYVTSVLCTAFRCAQLFYAVSLIASSTRSFVVMASGARTFAANLQGVKQVAFLRERHLAYLLASTRAFWHDKDIESLELKCMRFAKTFFNLVYVAYAVIILTPIARGSLPYVGNYPSFEGSFWLFAAMQAFQFAYDSIVTIAVDCMFLCLSLLTYAQFKLLNKRIARLGKGENALEEAVICVKYHNFLLKFVKIYAEMYSPALLIEYSIISLSVCIEVFVFTKQNALGQIASVFYLLTLVFQLSMYCFPAQVLIDEAQATSDAIFDANWNDDRQLAKTFVEHIMRRAQRRVKFTIGGLAQIDLESFTNIFKWSLSLYTLMSDIERLFD